LNIDEFWQDGVVLTQLNDGRLAAHVDSNRAREAGKQRQQADGNVAGKAARKAERMADSSYVEHKSGLPFSKTVDRLIETIEQVGMNIFAKIDHAAGAIEVGMDLPPTVVLIYGHARGGTPVMQAAPATSLDLPLRVLVREVKGGETVIAFHPVREMLARHVIPAELVDRLAKAQQLLVTAVQSGSK
jgi:uncharacterized protein (DUF302 family)